MMHLINFASPIDWPVNKPRTSKLDREWGRFSKKSAKYHRRAPTLHEARIRVSTAIDAFTKIGKTEWVIDPEKCQLKTMMATRKDGGLMARRATPDDPGCVLKFSWKGQTMTMAIDRYTSIEQNLCAIAACLDALRALERHDGNTLDQAMSGFAALPSPTTRRHWRDVFGGTDSTDLKALKLVYRKLAKVYHPDADGANDSKMAEINLAWSDAKAELKT